MHIAHKPSPLYPPSKAGWCVVVRVLAVHDEQRIALLKSDKKHTKVCRIRRAGAA